MFTIYSEYSESIEIKKSTFIAYLVPFNSFENKLEELKNEHKKARHIVWAYRYYNEFKQIVENSTDDGEPKNSSGKPVLKVLQGADLIDVALLVVRYFGGTKLGIGGLVRAYTEVSVKAVEKAEFIDLNDLFEGEIIIPYSLITQSEHIINSFDITIKGKEFLSESANFTLQGRQANIENAVNKISDLIKSREH